ncbi:MAG: hypothetical protein ACYTGH_13625 [Planctomycetota bacterium]|jgi:hypothetical protein
MSNLFVGAGNSLQEVTSVGLDEESLRDIETRIKLQPNFLGERLVVIGEAMDFPQVTVVEDVRYLIALDTVGQTVVIELRLGTARNEISFQGLRFASYLAHMTNEELGKIAHAFIQRPHNLAISRAWQEAGVEMSDEAVELTSLLATAFERDADDFSEAINRVQRIIVAGEGFDARMVEMVDWLSGAGADIRGVRYRKFMVGGQEIYFAEQVVPQVDPAVDGAVSRKAAAPESDEPWRTKGLQYYMDRLVPSVGNQLESLLQMIRPHTFSIDWSHKYYFMVRGARRNLRIRLYQRNRIDIGFLNTTVEVVNEHMSRHGLSSFEATIVGGYEKSPFISTTTDLEVDDRWMRALSDWLSGTE